MGKYIPVEPEKWAEMVKAMAEVTRLKAEVERLTKAGDAICAAYELGDDFLPPIQAWNAAKEGKPSV
jgi:hypothetical protein